MLNVGTLTIYRLFFLGADHTPECKPCKFRNAANSKIFNIDRNNYTFGEYFLFIYLFKKKIFFPLQNSFYSYIVDFI